jgi:thiamine-phosphate pyrophosphorylase
LRAEANPILCYVTDRKALGAAARNAAEGPHPETDLSGVIRRAVAASVNWIQIREKDLPTRPFVELVRGAVAAAQGSATRILVNDRLDIALATGAAGVHLGEASLPVLAVERWRRVGRAPAGFLVGASCHSPVAAVEAARAGADYIFFGPVFTTPSKAAYGSPQGLDRLAEVCRAVRVPVLAIGGVSLENAATCLAAGAAGLAAIRLFQESPDIAATVTQLRSAC